MDAAHPHDDAMDHAHVIQNEFDGFDDSDDDDSDDGGIGFPGGGDGGIGFPGDGDGGGDLGAGGPIYGAETTGARALDVDAETEHEPADDTIGRLLKKSKSKWLASNTWSRDVFWYRLPAPLGAEGSPPKRVRILDAVMKMYKPRLIFCFGFQILGCFSRQKI